MQLVKIDSLTAGYDGRDVLHDVNLTINSTDFIGVIGPNGGGKTTLVKAILSLIKPSAGKIEFASKSLKIGYMPQRHTIDTEFPACVTQVVLSGLQGSKKWWQKITPNERQRATKLMAQAGIGHLASRAISALSGGEMQRLLLCRSLMCEPELLILDEPTTYVDSKFELNFYQLIEKLSHRIAIVMVSHDLGTICSYVRTIACVNGTLHYHESNSITAQQLELYDCPLQIVSHGDVAHTVLHNHN